MPLDSQARLDDLLGILRANTATIAASLTSATTINTVKQGDARSLPVTLGGYPAILVKLSRETESFQQIGQRLNRHELEFTIACIVYQGIDPQTSDEDCVTMTKNLKGVLKSNITLKVPFLIVASVTIFSHFNFVFSQGQVFDTLLHR